MPAPDERPARIVRTRFLAIAGVSRREANDNDPAARAFNLVPNASLSRSAVVACVALCLVKRNNRHWPQDDSAFLDLDLEESLFAQA